MKLFIPKNSHQNNTDKSICQVVRNKCSMIETPWKKEEFTVHPQNRTDQHFLDTAQLMRTCASEKCLSCFCLSFSG